MASGLVAPIVDGELQTRTDSGDSLTKKSTNKNEIDSDMFLTLLVAEMQNQDPLEPTSNTEWVSQYATFTQVTKMSEMANTVDQLRGNSLVGKEVMMKVTSESTGEVSYKRGLVEYMMLESGKTILVIDGDKYNLDDLDSVISEEYSDAFDIYSEWAAKVNALPSIKVLNKNYEGVVRELYDQINSMTGYQQNFMKTYAAEEITKLGLCVAQLEKMGIKFEKPEVKPETTLDTILESFNTKMNAILDKLNKISPPEDTEEGDGDKDGDKEEEGNGDKTEKA